MTRHAPSGQSERGTHRKRRLKLAVVTSLGSKVSTVALQLIAFPIAIRAVSPHEFASYTVMAGVLSFIWLCDLGLGPALTQRIAIAHAAGDEPAQARLLASGVLAITGILCLGWALGVGLWQVPPLQRWLPTPGMDARVILAVAVIGSIQLFSSPFLRAQAGFQELHIYNLFGVAGNAVAAVALIAVAHGAPSALGFLMAVYGTAALTQVLVAAVFLVRRRYLLLGLLSPSLILVPPLLADGIRFAFPQVIVPIVLREGPKFMLFHKGLSMETAKYGVLIQLMTLASGLIVMFTQPLFPALTDAEARGDTAWIDSTYRRATLSIAAFCTLFIAGGVIAGPAALAIYTGNKFSFDRGTFLAFGICSALIFWNHLGQVFHQAAGRLGLFFKLSGLELVIFGAILAWRTPVNALTAFAYVAASLAPTAVLWSVFNRRAAIESTKDVAEVGIQLIVP
jgi:O-antigen/teichoic acid export membrane protein